MNSSISFHDLFGPVNVGFGTAGLGTTHNSFIIEEALKNGFRKFDTAEESDYWYNQDILGSTLESIFGEAAENGCDDANTADEHVCSSSDSLSWSCLEEGLHISTKIPPWELTSVKNIRTRAIKSRETLVGFCPDVITAPLDNQSESAFIEPVPFPMDIYYIHAPRCWDGWHTRCNGIGPNDLLPLREAWKAMEEVLYLDRSATRIGLSNVHEHELLDIIKFVQRRQNQRRWNSDARNDNGEIEAPPRMPDVLQSYADPLRPATRLRNICEKHNIEFVAYSTLGTQHGTSPNNNPVLTHPTILQLSHKYQKSTAEVVLSWALSKGMSIIPRSTKQHHIRELGNLLPKKGKVGKEGNSMFLEGSDLALIDAMALD